MKNLSKKQKSNFGASKDIDAAEMALNEIPTKQHNSRKRKNKDDKNTEPFIQ